MSEAYGIHWFRRDLRVAGNPAFKMNWSRHQGRVLGLFCFDRAFLSRPDFSAPRFALFMDSLAKLHEELQGLGGDLLFMDTGPEVSFAELFKKLPVRPSLVTWNRDYEPFARARDQKMAAWFSEQKVAHDTSRDHLLIEPHELTRKGSGEGSYQVYSPFARRWLEIFVDDDIQKRIREQQKGLEYLKKRERGEVDAFLKMRWKDLLPEWTDTGRLLKDYQARNQKQVKFPIPEGGSLKAYESLRDFVSRLDHYKDRRDLPAVQGTSGLSVFLKNGSLTVAQIIAELKLKPDAKKTSSRDAFLSELIWREFYYHILYHHPRVESESFLPQYKNLPWPNREDWFERWKTGTTGFPIVDAGMRQLATTGWMHNRVRMIVASFLTKDLLIDWRWGERYFMETLLDGDLAPNNGGWQWAASTGCDPQPYFRIFNPWSQSQKFDPNGEYIKTYVPELATVEAKALHAPILNHKSYPAPIVDHGEQRKAALALYKSVAAQK